MTIAIRPARAMYNAIKEAYPKATYFHVETELHGLNMVLEGKADAYIDFTTRLNRVELVEPMKKLVVNGQLPPNIRHEFSVAINTDQPLLVDIVNKSIAETNRKDISELYFRDITPIPEKVNYHLIWRASIAIGFFMLAIIIWNRYLTRINQQLTAANLKTLTAQEQANQALTKIEEMLNSSGEGFLSIGEDLLIDPEYSQACHDIFVEDGDLTERYLPELLCRNDNPSKASLTKGLNLLFKSPGKIQQEFIIDLLPSQIDINNKTLKYNYRFKRNKLYLIIEDISEQKKLQEQVEIEQSNMQRILYATLHRPEVQQVCLEFESFIQQQAIQILHSQTTIKEALSICYRRVHTYKSLFLQIHFSQLAKKLHRLEDTLSGFDDDTVTIDEICASISDININLCFQHEKKDILEKLGYDYFREIRPISLSRRQYRTMIQLSNQIPSSDIKTKLQTVLEQAGAVDIRELLRHHIDAAAEQAIRMGKKLNKRAISGEEILVSPNSYSRFCHSLLHVFRNAVAHGIEAPDERIAKGKPEEGIVQCSVSQNQHFITITIADDGRGIDTENIRNKISLHHDGDDLNLDNASDTELTKLIFNEGYSSVDSTTIDSGRGIGLPAVLDELEKIFGNVEIESEKGQGTLFVFQIPKVPITLWESSDLNNT